MTLGTQTDEKQVDGKGIDMKQASEKQSGAKQAGSKTASKHKAGAEVWPTRAWRTSTPDEEGMDGAKLRGVIESAKKQGLSLHSVIVIRHGAIVMERYFAPFDADTPHNLYSCTKSFVSALVGIAIKKGIIAGVSRPVMSYFPGGNYTEAATSMQAHPLSVQQPPSPRASSPFAASSVFPATHVPAPDAESKHAITVEHLLTMSSGLDWLEADETYERMETSSRDWVKFVLDIPMAAQPGQSFNYSSGNSHLLSAIIQKESRTNTYEFACENLFGPLGIKDPDWNRDPSGIPIGGWGLFLTPRDMAKLGYLYLHRGKWEHMRILPGSWVRESTQPHIKADGNWQYGYQWWLDPSQSFFAAIGRYGQTIFVVPAQDLVVVFTAHIDSPDPEVDLLKKYIIPACT
jgi:CubicO group peptidase (beta-lactamase class C family)